MTEIDSESSIESMAREIETLSDLICSRIKSANQEGEGDNTSEDSLRASQRLLILAARDISQAAVDLYTTIRQAR